MSRTLPRLTLQMARRLAVTRQRLAGPPAPPTVEGLLEVARALRCLQLDPISAVARSHLLVLWSRVGPYPLEALDHLLWTERSLFEYWAHAASIVLAEDFALHLPMMRAHARGEDPYSARVRTWLDRNETLRAHVLAEITRRGPLLSRELEADGIHPEQWVSTGWTSGRNVSRMLDHLWIGGEISVAGRRGGQKLWDLTDRLHPHWASADTADADHVTERAAELALRALGVARPAHIRAHFTRGRYPRLTQALERLTAAGSVVAVQVADDEGRELPGPWVVHAEDLAVLQAVAREAWQPRTTLLSPFDNLICDRARTRQMFDFDYTIEIYVPKDKRRFGYYVLPILRGDRLIGRVDARYERGARRLAVERVFAEAHAPQDAAAADDVRAAFERLGQFLGAREIAFSSAVPPGWARALR